MKIVTLNIQGGWKLNKIIDEIVRKLAPFDILVLQEVKQVGEIDHTDTILSELGNNFNAIKWYPTTFPKDKYGKMGNAIVYPNSLVLVKKKFLKIPDFKPSLLWRLLRVYFYPTQRLAISTVFKKNNNLIRVTNVHLEYSGGKKVRHNQVEYLLNKLKKEAVDTDIVLGDFNTIGIIDKSLPELEAFYERGYVLASKNIRFTADADSPDPNWFATPIIQFPRRLGFDLRQNLDHVLIKGEVKAKCKKVKINSSDHDAVVCEI